MIKILFMFFRTIKCLAILIPPLVDPVLPPENIIRKRSITAVTGQKIKSVDANPVQVIIEIIWKNPLRNDSSNVPVELESRISVAAEPAMIVTTM